MNISRARRLLKKFYLISFFTLGIAYYFIVEQYQLLRVYYYHTRVRILKSKMRRLNNVG